MNRGSPQHLVILLPWLASIALWMWLAMLLTHELGHLITARLTGGGIVATELRPGRLPHTLVRPNPHPSLVLWGGLLCGWLSPQATAPLWRIERGLIGPVLRAWAAFCLLAGGGYLAIGVTQRLADTGRLIAHGWSAALLIAVGVAVAVVGYARSRAAWLAMFKRFETQPITWTTALGWLLFTAGWWGAQSALGWLLEPGR